MASYKDRGVREGKVPSYNRLKERVLQESSIIPAQKEGGRLGEGKVHIHPPPVSVREQGGRMRCRCCA